MWSAIQSVLKQIDDFCLGCAANGTVLSGGLLLTVRLGHFAGAKTRACFKMDGSK